MPDSFDPLSLLALGATIGVFIGLIGLRLRRVGFTTLVLIALAAGIGIGIGFRGHLDFVGFLGDAYIQIITAIVAPLIFISILSSITSLGSLSKLRTTGASSVFWLLLTNAIAIVITLAVAISLGLGRGAQLDLPEAGVDALEGLVQPLDQVLLGLLPRNFVGDFASNAILPIILFAVTFAIANLVAARNENRDLRAFKRFVDGSKQVMMAAVGFVIELTPYAVLALVATTTATAITRVETILSLIGVLVLGFAITFADAYLVNGVLLRVFGDVNPIRWFRFLTPAQYTAFTTQSSVGTLPITIPTLTRKVGVPEEVASFTAPLGTTIGMPGCSGIWPMLSAVFAINVLGIDYSVWDYLALAGLALLVSLGTAGVPGTAIVTATAVFTAAGLPIEILVVLIPISAIVGTASTMSNVTAAATAATIVARRQGVLDDAIFSGTGTGTGRDNETPGGSASRSDGSDELGSAEQDPEEWDLPLSEQIPVGQCELPGSRSTLPTATTTSRS